MLPVNWHWVLVCDAEMFSATALPQSCDNAPGLKTADRVARTPTVPSFLGLRSVNVLGIHRHQQPISDNGQLQCKSSVACMPGLIWVKRKHCASGQHIQPAEARRHSPRLGGCMTWKWESTKQNHCVCHQAESESKPLLCVIVGLTERHRRSFILSALGGWHPRATMGLWKGGARIRIGVEISFN
jgi:hypothetical protein